MSDDEVEVECGEEDSGEEDCFGDGEVEEGGVENNAERRAHHNALERKRRDHIKDSFEKLKESIPRISEKTTRSSRTEILKQATNYIRHIQEESATHQTEISDLRRQNQLLEQQIRRIERLQSSGQFSSSSSNSSTTSNGADLANLEYDQQVGEEELVGDLLLREASPAFSSSGSESGSLTSREDHFGGKIPADGRIDGHIEARIELLRESSLQPETKRLKLTKK